MRVKCSQDLPSLWFRDGINGRSAGLQHQVWLGWLRLTAPHPLARRFPSSSLPAHVRLLAAATSAAPLLRVRHLSPRHGPDVRISNGGRTCRVHQGARRDHLTLPRDDHHPRPPARPAPPWPERRRGGVRPPSTVLPLPTLRLAYRCPVLENSSITCHRSVCTRTISAATRRSRRRLCCTMSAPSYLFCAPLPPSGAGGITLGFGRYVGAAIIFRDPIGASGAACDCDALLRLINVRTRPQMQNKPLVHTRPQMRNILPACANARSRLGATGTASVVSTSLSLDCAGAQHCQCHADQCFCRRSQLGRR